MTVLSSIKNARSCAFKIPNLFWFSGYGLFMSLSQPGLHSGASIARQNAATETLSSSGSVVTWAIASVSKRTTCLLDEHRRNLVACADKTNSARSAGHGHGTSKFVEKFDNLAALKCASFSLILSLNSSDNARNTIGSIGRAPLFLLFLYDSSIVLLLIA